LLPYVRQEIAEAQRLIARIGARQHGIVTFGQLVWAGFSPSTISRRVREGWLHRLHRGVYAVGHTNLSNEGRIMAAVLACGEGAVASHESAAYLWSMSPTCPPSVQVTIPSSAGRANRKRIVVHHSITLTPADTTRRRGIPATTAARTRQDLRYDRGPTRSGLERLFLRICRDHGIPRPEVNPKVGRYRPDFLWRAARLIVEVDGYRYHSDRRAFQVDRARDRYFQARGLAVMRFADEELELAPEGVARSVLNRLAQSGQE
jgi:very-short-patch-repair endonuclease